MEEYSDNRLVEMAQAGDVEAFAELARRYQGRLFRTVLSLTRDWSDADDLTQEAFMQAFRALRRFNQDSGFYTWLYWIAVNLTLNYLKRSRPSRRMRRDLDPEMAPETTAADAAHASPESRSLNRELGRRLKEAVDALPLGYRLAFVLVEVQGMSHRQASDVLKCSENTVSWRMHRARRMLQSRLRPYLNGGTP
jgi:RNA polymerase sigma-70 factor (ECF subfamily)